MLLSVFILGFNPVYLRVSCAVGFTSALLTIFFALRRSRVLHESRASRDFGTQNSAVDSPSIRVTSESEASPQVIRLSLPPVSARSTEMTQQEKVAAALMRAGIASPSSWIDSSPATDASALSESTSTAVAELPSHPGDHYVIHAQPSALPTRLSWPRKLLFLAGSVLALGSAYLFLRIH